MVDLMDDWTAEDADLARAILQNLGFAQEASMEPGIDPRRDRMERPAKYIWYMRFTRDLSDLTTNKLLDCIT